MGGALCYAVLCEEDLSELSSGLDLDSEESSCLLPVLQYHL